MPTPPPSVSAAAQRGLKLREKHGRGGTKTGLARARQLANRRNVSRDDLLNMWGWFSRHSVYYAEKTPPTNAEISWLLWGGFPGVRWVAAQLGRTPAANKPLGRLMRRNPMPVKEKRIKPYKYRRNGKTIHVKGHTRKVKTKARPKRRNKGKYCR